MTHTQYQVVRFDYYENENGSGGFGNFEPDIEAAPQPGLNKGWAVVDEDLGANMYGLKVYGFATETEARDYLLTRSPRVKP